MGNDIFLDTICHSDDQREEESREHPHWQISICYRDSSLRSEWQWVLTEILLLNYVLIIFSTSLHFSTQSSCYQTVTKCRELFSLHDFPTLITNPFQIVCKNILQINQNWINPYVSMLVSELLTWFLWLGKVRMLWE